MSRERRFLEINMGDVFVARNLFDPELRKVVTSTSLLVPSSAPREGICGSASIYTPEDGVEYPDIRWSGTFYFEDVVEVVGHWDLQTMLRNINVHYRKYVPSALGIIDLACSLTKENYEQPPVRLYENSPRCA